MTKPFRLAAAAVLSTGLAAPALAEDFGDFSWVTVQKLTIDYAGRHTGTAAFDGASDWMQERFESAGLTVSRQVFTTRRGLTSNNVITSIEGAGDGFILVGAHFDSAPQRAGYAGPPLQGVDDNGSGAAVLTELAAHMAGLELQTGLVFNGFGAEETGLEGSAAYRDSLSADELSRLKGMINIDSLITGDFMYAHAGANYLANPALKSYWARIHAIADELGIDLRSNPGLNPDYPIDTGCCSDGEVFTDLDIPVLFIESTNWDIGDLDGYEQTTNPAIPGGATWHNPALDNWDVLTAAFGPDRIPDRLEAYSLLLTRLLVELTDADAIASARAGGAVAYVMADQVARQEDALAATVDRGVLSILAARREPGTVTFAAGVEGLYRPEDGFDDGLPVEQSYNAAITLHADYQFDSAFNLAGDLRVARSRDDLEAGGDITSTAVGLSLGVVYGEGTPPWAALSVFGGRADIDGARDFRLVSGLGAVILDESFEFDTDATTYGARFQGGYDFPLGGVFAGPVAGIDYVRYEIDGASEGTARRTALTYGEADFDSAEATVGLRVRGSLPLLEGVALSPYGSLAYVNELADGRPDSFDVTAAGDGVPRRITVADYDTSFGRALVGAGVSLAEGVNGFVEVGTRIGHDDGAQTGVTAGFGLSF